MKVSQQDIFNTALRFFGEVGYDNTTFQMIADEFELTKSAVAYHVKNKGKIVYHFFYTYIQSLHEFVRPKLTDNFNYYLYYCIIYTYLFRAIMKDERYWKLFYQHEHLDIWAKDKLNVIEHSYRLISNDFNKDLTEEDVRVAALMDTGARFRLVEEFEHSNGTMDIDRYCYYHIYHIGILSRLDEATIKKNIDRAFEFANRHTSPEIFKFG